MAGRRGPSIQKTLLVKSREAALNAVQTYNNPLTKFKAETFIVLMNIAWMYLLHAYYKRDGLEYRYFERVGKRRKFDRTGSGAFKYWGLEHSLHEKTCPVDNATQQNLHFLIGLRHEIEHHMPAGSEERFSDRYLACCLNFERYICELFGSKYSLADNAAFALQLRDFRIPREPGESASPLPSNVAKYVQDFETSVDSEVLQSPHFSYRTTFVRRHANRPGQADKAFEFIGGDSELAQQVEKQYWVYKDVERPKYLPSQIIKIMHQEGYPRFSIYYHTQLWKAMDAKNPGKGFGVMVANSWYWYERWVEEVRKHCSSNIERYRPGLAA